MPDLDVTVNANLTNKTEPVGDDRLIIVDSETNPNSLKDIKFSDLLSSDAESITGTATDRGVTPASLRAVLVTKSMSNNVLANGGFRVSQRATTFTSATTFVNNDDSYLLDATVLLSDGNDIVDVSQVADTDFVSGFKIRLDVETANKRFGILLPVGNKNIQDIRKSGKASLQFKAKCTGTSMSNVRASVLAWSSTADTITSDVISAWNTAGNNPTLVSNWTAENTAANIAVTTTVALNKIENITVDTASVTNLAVLIIVDDTDATVGDFLEIGDVKLENGIFCSDFVNKEANAEILECSRRLSFYSLASGNVVGSGYAGGAGTTAIVGLTTPVPMATTPAVAIAIPAAGDFTVRANGGSNVATVVALTAYKNNIATITFTATATANHAAAAFANTNTHLLLTSEL